jgi:hypothetical protein
MLLLFLLLLLPFLLFLLFLLLYPFENYRPSCVDSKTLRCFILIPSAVTLLWRLLPSVDILVYPAEGLS